MNVQRQHDIEPVINDFELDDERGTKAPSAKLKPFADGRVNGLFYPGALRQEALDQLLHLLRYGPSLLLLHGDQGVGKQYLVDQLVQRLDPELFDIAQVQAGELQGVEALLAALSEPWHSRSGFSLEGLQHQITECATAADDESRILLLVVRRAQFLDQFCVDMLARLLAYSAGMPVKILMLLDAMDPSDVDSLVPLLDQIPDHYSLALAPLTLAETGDYLSYRMRTSGMGQTKFSRQQIERIHNLSLGNVERINEVASDVLRSALGNSRQKPMVPPLPWMHVGALALVAAVLVVLLLTRGGPEPAESVQNAALADLAADREVAEADARLSRALGEGVAGEGALREGTPQDAPQESADMVSVPAQTPPGSATSGVEQSKPATESPATATKEVVVVKQPEPAQQPDPSPVRASTPAKSAPRVDARTAWVLGLPSEHYALQLLGAKEKETVDKFLAMYPSVQKLSYYRTVRNGAPWYVVVQASFPSYDAAKAAVSKLPQKLQNQGPWIRKIEAIQKDLKN